MVKFRQAIASDFRGILALQADNLLANLSPGDLAGGFVTTPFSPELLQQLVDRSGVFVAEHDRKIIGYILAGDWDFFSQWEIFRVMIARMPDLRFQDREIAIAIADGKTLECSFQYGPVCIDRAWRGSEIFPQLFDLMRSSFAPKYPIGMTFINQLNQRSLAAHHRKLGMEIVDRFDLNGNSFYTLAFTTRAKADSFQT